MGIIKKKVTLREKKSGNIASMFLMNLIDDIYPQLTIEELIPRHLTMGKLNASILALHESVGDRVLQIRTNPFRYIVVQDKSASILQYSIESKISGFEKPVRKELLFAYRQAMSNLDNYLVLDLKTSSYNDLLDLMVALGLMYISENDFGEKRRIMTYTGESCLNKYDYKVEDCGVKNRDDKWVNCCNGRYDNHIELVYIDEDCDNL